MTRRQQPPGTLYQRSSDGRWCVSLELPRSPGGKRRRHVITSSNRADLEQVLAQWRIAHPVTAPLPRPEDMEHARSLGTRTRAETIAKRRAQPDVCPYCRTGLNLFNQEEDHIIPVAAGGSDAIGNIQWTCWECNRAKGANPNYRYRGRRPRPFHPAPNREREFLTMRKALA